MTSGMLLDTHIWLWLENNTKSLRAPHRALAIAAAEADELWISVASVWEIAMLTAKQRIDLSMPVRVWVREALGRPGVRMMPLDQEVALDSYDLPGVFHGDPADRMIVATARLLNVELLTYDKEILAYADDGHVRVRK